LALTLGEILDEAYIAHWQGGGWSNDQLATIAGKITAEQRIEAQAMIQGLTEVAGRDHVSRVKLDFIRRALGT
jgi:hypothetical protein